MAIINTSVYILCIGFIYSSHSSAELHFLYQLLCMLCVFMCACVPQTHKCTPSEIIHTTLANQVREKATQRSLAITSCCLVMSMCVIWGRGGLVVLAADKGRNLSFLSFEALRICFIFA